MTTLREYRGIEPDADLLFIVRAYATIEGHLTRDWMAGGMRIDPTEFGRLMEQCVPPRLHEALAIA